MTMDGQTSPCKYCGVSTEGLPGSVCVKCKGIKRLMRDVYDELLNRRTTYGHGEWTFDAD